MEFITAKEGFIFRFTHIDNLSFILNNNITCRQCEPKNSNFKAIGNDNIIAKRDQKRIKLSPFGTLSDYIPFYFAPRSPMLYSIHKAEKVTQDTLIYLVSKISMINKLNLKYIFTDGHPIINYTRFFNNIKDIDQVDWELMKNHYWLNTKEDNDRKRRRMAEFLVYQMVPIEAILYIVTQNKTITQKTKSILNKSNFANQIGVGHRGNWYFK